MGIKEIHDGIYLIGSSDITDTKDCCVYLLNLGEFVLIDTGAGSSVGSLVANIDRLGFKSTPPVNDHPDTLSHRSYWWSRSPAAKIRGPDCHARPRCDNP